MLTQFMHSLAGSYNSIIKYFIFAIILGSAVSTRAENREPDAIKMKASIAWAEIKDTLEKRDEENYKNGLSYIISGSSAVVAGVLGERASKDTVDKGIYSVFQIIGVSSIAYGAYKWKISEPDTLFIRSLESNENLTPAQKFYVMQDYYRQKKEQDKQERYVRAIAHGLAGALNIYGAAVQDDKNIRNGLFFFAGVNILATISFTF